SKESDNNESEEREPGGADRYQDRPQPLARAAKHELHAEYFALKAFEMLEVVDHDDSVARGDAKHRQKTNQRAQRNHASRQPRRQHAADQRRRKGHETERCQPPAFKRLLQKDEDDGEREDGEQLKSPARSA